jgi:catechol 2,3-dioxygenase-like lactoylglutathione lyase family enzyme
MPIAARRTSHLNVNCADLERSLAFYRDLVGLEAYVRTAPEEPQPGAAFGLDRVQWDAWILRGATGDRAVVLDLLQWLVPSPTGRPATDARTTGFNRLCFTTPDLDGTYRRMVDAGVDVWSPPSDLQIEGGRPARLFVCSDPDGTQVELIGGPAVGLSHVAINTADHDRSVAYYRDVMNLEVVMTPAFPTQPGTIFRIDGDISMRSTLLRDPRSGFMVELIDWHEPTVVPRPAPVTNQLGIFRLAWVTRDIEADHTALLAHGITPFSPPADVEMGPGVPNLKAIFWGDPDGACNEVIQTGTGPA